MDKNQTI